MSKWLAYPDIHPRNFGLHSCKAFSDVDQRRSVSHRRSSFLHFIFDYIKLISYIGQKSRSLNYPSTNLHIHTGWSIKKATKYWAIKPVKNVILMLLKHPKFKIQKKAAYRKLAPKFSHNLIFPHFCFWIIIFLLFCHSLLKFDFWLPQKTKNLSFYPKK